MDNLLPKFAQPHNRSPNTIVVSSSDYLKILHGKPAKINFNTSHLVGQRIKIIDTISRRFIHRYLYANLGDYSYFVEKL